MGMLFFPNSRCPKQRLFHNSLSKCSTARLENRSLGGWHPYGDGSAVSARVSWGVGGGGGIIWTMMETARQVLFICPFSVSVLRSVYLPSAPQCLHGFRVKSQINGGHDRLSGQPETSGHIHSGLIHCAVNRSFTTSYVCTKRTERAAGSGLPWVRAVRGRTVDTGLKHNHKMDKKLICFLLLP